MRKAWDRFVFVKETIGDIQYEHSFHFNIFDPVLSAIHSVASFSMCILTICLFAVSY